MGWEKSQAIIFQLISDRISFPIISIFSRAAVPNPFFSAKANYFTLLNPLLYIELPTQPTATVSSPAMRRTY